MSAEGIKGRSLFPEAKYSKYYEDINDVVGRIGLVPSYELDQEDLARLRFEVKTICGIGIAGPWETAEQKLERIYSLPGGAKPRFISRECAGELITAMEKKAPYGGNSYE